jgi:DNA (cytosine-5)-methyltransferase 1
MTPAEHARVKSIPVKLIEGLGLVRAHEVLGQSVIYCAFVAVGILIAKTVTGLAASLTKPQPVNREEKAANTQLKECPATLPLFALTA